MDEMQNDWDADVDRGPDWLFVRLHPGRHEPTDVADKLLSIADRHFIYRLVVEMNEVNAIPSRLMGQLVTLQKRVLQRDGALRLCGLSPECAQALHFCRLDRALPNYDTRENAVRGFRGESVLA